MAARKRRNTPARKRAAPPAKVVAKPVTPAAPAKSSQQILAEMLSLTTRQVRNLTDEGVFQRTIESGKPEYDVPKCVQAYYKHKAEREKGSPVKETILDLNVRKLEIDVRVGELALEQQLGQLVTLDYMEEQIKGLLERLRARCLNMPGKFARDMADAEDPAAALIVLERLSTELLQSMSEAGEDPELDDEAEETEEPAEGTDAGDAGE